MQRFRDAEDDVDGGDDDVDDDDDDKRFEDESNSYETTSSSSDMNKRPPSSPSSSQNSSMVEDESKNRVYNSADSTFLEKPKIFKRNTDIYSSSKDGNGEKRAQQMRNEENRTSVEVFFR